jgi:hypothetical protein
LPDFRCAASQRGFLPRPAQVFDGHSGFRYLREHDKADSERACRLRLDFPIPTTQPEIDNVSRAAAEEPMVWTSPRIAPLMAKKTEVVRVTICGLGL